MLQDYECHPGIGRQTREKTLERFEPACRCANPDDREIDPLVDHHGLPAAVVEHKLIQPSRLPHPARRDCPCRIAKWI
jgi:hypothetical protein